MKVLYIHQYFRKPSDGGAVRSYYLAKSLVEKGINVDLITSHNHKSIRTENIDGINVHFLPVPYDNKLSTFKRIISFFKFAILAYKYTYKLEKPTYTYISSTPLTVGITALLLKKIRNYNYFFEVRDLWPEAPIQMGILKNKLLKNIFYSLEKHSYKNATKIIALSPGMAEGIKKYNFNNPIEVIPNISDCDFFQNEEKDIKNEFYYGVGDKKVVSYIGAIGKVNALETLLNAALECQKNKLEISFLIAGRGRELKKLKDKAYELQLKNIRFLGFLNRKELKQLLNITDFSFISFADKPILETNSPNKFFDSIASGKICIVNNRGWIKDIIEENEIGFYYPKNSPQLFVQKIKTYLENPPHIILEKSKSRTIAETKFSRMILTKKFIHLFEPELAPKEQSKNAKVQVYN